MKALYHVHGPWSASFAHHAREANERRWCILDLNTPPVVYQACIKYTTGGLLSIADMHIICLKYWYSVEQLPSFSQTATLEYNIFGIS